MPQLGCYRLITQYTIRCVPICWQSIHRMVLGRMCPSLVVIGSSLYTMGCVPICWQSIHRMVLGRMCPSLVVIGSSRYIPWAVFQYVGSLYIGWCLRRMCPSLVVIGSSRYTMGCVPICWQSIHRMVLA